MADQADPKWAKVESALARRVAGNVEAARKQLGISRQVLASRSGISATTVRRVELGIRPVSLRVLARLAHVLGVDPAELVLPVLQDFHDWIEEQKV